MLSKMMVIQAQSSPVVGENLTRVNKEPSKANVAQEPKTKQPKVDEKEKTNGLRVPGSNWEKYKILLAESKAIKKEPVESTSVTSPRKRHRPRKRPGPNKQTNLSDDSQADVHLKALKELHHAQKTDPILTKQIAMDCEMVGIGDGNESMLARISIVNKYGVCLYDKYVKPTEEVKDYRSAVSGIYPHHLKDAEKFKIVQKEVAEMLRGRLLVGHALKNDLEVLYLSHPRHSQRDTSRYKTFRKIVNGNTPSLKKLAHELLGVKIQMGEHSSVEDARSAMQLYMLYRNKWEQEIRTKRR